MENQKSKLTGYKVLSKIGEGTFGWVYHVIRTFQNDQLPLELAIKVANEDILYFFNREQKII